MTNISANPTTEQDAPKICAVCKTPNPAAARFCYNCGTPLAATAMIQERRYVTVVFADLSGFTALSSRLDAEEVRVLQEAYFERVRNAITGMGGIVEKFIGDAAVGIFGAPKAHEDDAERAVQAALQIKAAVEDLCVECEIGIEAELDIHIGVNSGLVVSGRNPVDGSYTVTGDTVNVAARLQQNAEAGEILVGEATYRASSTAIEYAPTPIQITVRGKDEPLLAWQALGIQAQPETARSPAAQTPLIDRNDEMDALRDFYRRTSLPIYGPDGEPVFRLPALAIMTGEAGIGKSRLTGELVNWLNSLPGYMHNRTVADEYQVGVTRPDILKGRCLPYGSGITYWTLAEIVKSDCGISYNDTAEVARTKLLGTITRICRTANQAGMTTPPPEQLAYQIGYTIGISLSETAETPSIEYPASPGNEQRYREKRDALDMRAAWRIYFQARAAVNPLVILLEDLHWAEDSLLDLLEYIISASEPMIQQRTGKPGFILQRIMWVALARPEFLERRPTWVRGPVGFQGSTLTLRLRPLDQSQTRLLVDTLLPESLPATMRAKTVEAIVNRSEGIPFFAEELTKMFSEYCETGNPENELPETIQAVLAARIDRLPTDEKLVLRAAAVFGRFFWPGAIARLAESLSPSAVLAALDRLVERDMMVRRPSAAVLPVGDSEVSGPNTPYGFRHTLIRDVAYAGLPRALRARQHAILGAWLEESAGERQAEFVELLAYHYEQSTLLTRTGAGTPRREHLGRRAVYYLGLAGDRLRSRKAYAAAHDYYSRAIDLLREVEPIFQATIEQPEMLQKVAAHPLGARYLSMLLAHGAVLEVQGDYMQGIGQVELACELARVSGDKRGEATANSQLCVLYRNASAFEAASNAGRTALRLFGDLGDRDGQARALQNLGVLSYFVYQFLPSLQYLRAGLTLYRETGNLYGQAACLRYIGEVLYDRASSGDWQAATEALHEALNIYHKLSDRRGEAAVLQNMALGNFIRGNISESSALFRQALLISLEVGDRRGEAVSHRGMSWIESARGNYVDALDDVLLAYELSKNMGDKRGEVAALTDEATLLLDQGAIEEAERVLNEAKQIRTTFHGRIFWTAVGLRIARARLELAQGHLEEALELAREAVDDSAPDDTYARGISLRMLGIVESTLGKRAEEEGFATEAAAYYERAGIALRESLKLFGNAGDRIELARSYVAYAHHLRRSGNPTEATSFEIRAIEIFEAARLRGELERMHFEG